ncbi:TPA: hypothetical protein HA231_03195 [Candidatus Woesearchaeota archaeon]|nr:hypothetical protein [Candidatus Woesearchaeota archaeon]
MKERLTALTFLMVTIGALYAFDGLNSGAFSANSVTGFAVSEQRIAQQDVSCYDSDNRNYEAQGTTYASLFESTGEKPKSDVCEGSTLIEYFCAFNEPQVEFHECENGCYNGGCA